MDKIFLVSSSEQSTKALSAFLSREFVLSIAKSGSEARRMLMENDFDIIVVNSPLTDEFGHDLALHAAENTLSGVMLLVREEIADAVSEKVEDSGVFVVSKPLNKQAFYSAFKLIRASKKRLYSLQNENQKLQKRLDDMKLINKAKWLLVEKCHMTEPEAHSYIEQEAMNLRLPKSVIATKILNDYEIS